MDNNRKKLKDAQIKKELKKLQKTYENVDEDNKFIVNNILNQVAFILVTLEDLKNQVNEDGAVSMFKQGAQEFLREHPAIQSFNKTVKTYQSLLKQLYEITNIKEKDEDDELMNFIKGKK